MKYIEEKEIYQKEEKLEKNLWIHVVNFLMIE